MKMSPRTLLVIAANATAWPAIAMFASQLIIWAIPGCDPSPYATEGCVLLGLEVGAALLIGVLGGIYLTVAMAVLVSAPLTIAAAAWHLIRRKPTCNVD
jgi:hypothetical protein